MLPGLQKRHSSAVLHHYILGSNSSIEMLFKHRKQAHLAQFNYFKLIPKQGADVSYRRILLTVVSFSRRLRARMLNIDLRS